MYTYTYMYIYVVGLEINPETQDCCPMKVITGKCLIYLFIINFKTLKQPVSKFPSVFQCTLREDTTKARASHLTLVVIFIFY